MPLTDSLIAFWKLEEASGTRVDEIGNNDLTDNNTVTQATGKVGNCAQFTAANLEYLSIADNPDLSFADEDFTFALWVYFDSLTNYRILLMKDNASAVADDDLPYRIYTNDGNADKITFNVGNNTISGSVADDTLGTPSTATWYFVVAWHDSVANTVNIRVNNGTADSASYSGGSFDDGSPFSLGRQDVGGLYHDGRLDAVGVWGRVLTSGEQTELWNGGNGRETPFASFALLDSTVPGITDWTRRYNR